MANDEYLKEFKAPVEFMDDYNSCVLGKFPCLMETKVKKCMKKKLMKQHLMNS